MHMFVKLMRSPVNPLAHAGSLLDTFQELGSAPLVTSTPFSPSYITCACQSSNMTACQTGQNSPFLVHAQSWKQYLDWVMLELHNFVATAAEGAQADSD